MRERVGQVVIQRRGEGREQAQTRGKEEKVVRSEGKGIRQRCPGKALRVRGSDLILESRVGSVSPVFSVLKQDQWVSETCLAELQLMRTHSDSSFSARWSLCAL